MSISVKLRNVSDKLNLFLCLKRFKNVEIEFKQMLFTGILLPFFVFSNNNLVAATNVNVFNLNSGVFNWLVLLLPTCKTNAFARLRPTGAEVFGASLNDGVKRLYYPISWRKRKNPPTVLSPILEWSHASFSRHSRVLVQALPVLTSINL